MRLSCQGWFSHDPSGPRRCKEWKPAPSSASQPWCQNIPLPGPGPRSPDSAGSPGSGSLSPSSLRRCFSPAAAIFIIDRRTGGRYHLLQAVHVFSFKLHCHLLIFSLHWVFSKRMIFMHLVHELKFNKYLEVFTFTLLSLEMSWMCLR